MSLSSKVNYAFEALSGITVGNINITGNIFQNNNPYIASQWTSTSGNAITYTSGNVNVQNLLTTNISASTLQAPNGITVGNINFTGSLFQNGSAYIGSQWTSTSGNVITYTSGNVVVSNAISSGSIVSTNVSAGNITSTGLTAGILYSSSSRVGINTTNPLLNFDIRGSSFGIRSSDTTPHDHLYFGLNSTESFIRAGGAENGLFIDIAAGSNYTYGNTSYTRVATFTSTGNVGIGTTTPAFTLDVNGTTRVATGMTIGTGFIFGTSTATLGSSALNIGSGSVNISTGSINFTGGSINFTGGSINMTAGTVQLIGTSTASIANLVTTTATLPNLVNTNILNTNISTTTLLAGTNVSTASLQTINASIGNLSIGNIQLSGNMTVGGNVLVAGTLVSVNVTSVNLIENNITTANIVGADASFGNLKVTNWTNANFMFTNSTIMNTILTNFTASNIITNSVNYGMSSTFSGSFAAANNVTSGSPITGVIFDSDNIRYFNATVTVTLETSTPSTLVAVFTLRGTFNGTWSIISSYIGDNTGITFSIDSSTGQVTYISTNTANWISNTFRYRVDQFSVDGTYSSVLGSTVSNYILNTVQISNTSDAIAGTNVGGLEVIGGATIRKALVTGNNKNIITSAGNVGFNTTAPSTRYNVDINGSLRGLRVDIGGTQPTYNNNTLGRLFITGTQNSAVSGPNILITTAQDLFPTYNFLTYGHDAAWTMYDMYFDGSSFRNSGTTTAFMMVKENSTLKWNYNSAGFSAGALATVGTSICIGSGGNVGLGGNVTPVYTLDVSGGARITSGLTVGNINFTGTLSQNGAPYIGSQWVGTSGTLYYGTAGSSVVGINTTSPAFTLDVSGGARIVTGVTAGASTFTSVSAGNSQFTGLSAGNINFTGNLFQNGSPYIGSQWVGTSGNITFGTAGSSLVGINTTSPAYTLDINGSLRATNSLFTNSTITNMVFTNLTANNLMTNNLNLGVSSMFSGSFVASNNISVPANITGFAFTNANIRAFNASVSVSVLVSSGTNLYAVYTLIGNQTDSGWTLLVDNVGDAGITFSMTSGGQVQYTSTNVTNFTSSTFRYNVQQFSATGTYSSILGNTQGAYIVDSIQINSTQDVIPGTNNGSLYLLGGANITKSLQVGGSIFNSAGNIGIGTTIPAYTLDVNGTLEASNSNGLMLFASSGNLGIGTTSPTNKLEVSGAISQFSAAASNYNGYLKTNNNTQSSTTLLNPGILLFSLNNTFNYGMDLGSTATGRYRTRIFAPNTADIAFSFASTAGSTSQSGFTDRVVITGDGNVGIGTTSPIYTLDVTGTLEASNSNGLMLFASSGNLGIGTTSPSANVHIRETTATGGNPSGIFIDKLGERSVMQVWGYSNSRSSLLIGSNTYWSNVGSILMHHTGGNAAGWYMLMGSQSDGFRVSRSTAINTDVDYFTMVSSGSVQFNMLILDQPNYMRIGRIDNTIRYHDLEFQTSVTSSSTYMAVKLHNGVTTTSQTEVIRLRADGNVGIGTTTPSTKLDVVGSIRSITGTSSSILINSDGAAGWGNFEMFGTNGAYIDFKNASGDDYDARIKNVGSNNSLGFYMNAAETTGMSLTSAGTLLISGDIGAFASISDRTLKTNITDISPDTALQTVKTLRPVTFNWKDDIFNAARRGEFDSGFIAQEVEEVIPHAVGTYDTIDHQNTYKNMRHERIIPYLVGSIQKLESVIVELKERIGFLESQ